MDSEVFLSSSTVHVDPLPPPLVSGNYSVYPLSIIHYPPPFSPLSPPPPQPSSHHLIMSLRPLSVSSRSVLHRSYGTVQSPASAVNNRFPFSSVLQQATTASSPRTSWSKDEVKEIYETPLTQLAYAAVRLSSFIFFLVLFCQLKLC